MKRAPAPARTSPLLGVYLNDHFAGATAGVALLRRAARTQHTRAGAVTWMNWPVRWPTTGQPFSRS